jgi:mycothiol synthase
VIGAFWRSRLVAGELDEAEELARACSEHDQEAGFSQITPSILRTGGRHLLVRAEEPGAPLVAYLHLDDQGRGTLVVHPDARSNGVATIVLETVELPGAQGWAEGHHPAAERLARRFGCKEKARIWRSVLPLSGPYAPPLPRPAIPLTEDPDPGAARRLWLASGLPERYRPPGDGSARLLYAAGPEGTPDGYAWLDHGTRTVERLRTGVLRAIVPAAQGAGTGLSLAAGALALLRDEGVQAAEARLDPALPRALRLARLLGFQRTQDDVLYTANEPPELRES